MRRCDDLLAELQKQRAHNARETERYKLQSKSAKQQWSAQEKVKREEWVSNIPNVSLQDVNRHFVT